RICRKRPWIRSMGLLFVITIPVAVLAVIVPMRIWHVGIGGAILISVLSVLAFWWLLEAMGTDVLTSTAAGLAAVWQRERAGLASAGPFPGALDPASLERYAFAIAVGAQTASAGAAPRRRPARPASGPPAETREPPREIW